LRLLILLSMAAALWGIWPQPAALRAQEGVSQVSLLPGWRMENGHRMVGVRIDLDPGWKTYWRAPGSNGIPPMFDFAGSANLRQMLVYWPTPRVIDENGTRTIGYKNSVVFPVELVPGAAGDMQIDLDLSYGVCADVCIPARTRVTARLAPQMRGGEVEIRAALADLPKPARDAGVTGVTCDLRPDGDRFSLIATVMHDHAAQADVVAIFETGSEETWVSARAIRAEGNQLVIDATLSHFGSGPLALDRSQIRLTLLAAGSAVDIQGCPAG